VSANAAILSNQQTLHQHSVKLGFDVVDDYHVFPF
jgi:hypothetical protein